LISSGNDDFMELGTLVPLEDGWFLDIESDTKFRLDEDGLPVNESGQRLSPDDMYGDK